MDIEILLALQNFRNGIGNILVDFIAKATFFGEMNTVIVIMALIYWCIDKKLGSYLLMGFSGNRLLNGFLKVTFCVYRPWIRDPRVLPHEASMLSATGYSFPSGHATNASSLYGGGLVNKKTPFSLRMVLLTVILLIGFSRIYLGVHTPQDVLIGASAGLLVMWLTLKLTKWLKNNPGKDYLVVLAGLLLAIILGLYAAFKSYPVDLNETGKVIVDGAKMALDTFKATGWCAGFMIGWLLERHMVNFDCDISLNQQIMRCLCGLIGLYIVSLIIMPEIKKYLPASAATVLSCMLQMFYISFIFPLLIKKTEKR